MTRLILKLFDLLAPLVRALGVDYGQFRAILETKLILDTRRRTVHLHTAEKAKKPGNAFAGTLAFYAFMSIMFAPIIVSADAVTGAAVLHLFVMVMVGLSLVADFSSVLLDTTDNAILQPRPVSGRTVLVARLAHIAVYLAALSLSLSLIPMITGAVAVHPLYPLVYLATLACSIALVVFLVNLFYLVAMRLVSGERLRDLLMYVQIGLAVLTIGAYQFMPRLMNVAVLSGWQLEQHPWAWSLPPVWFAAPMDVLAGRLGGVQLALSGLAVAAPLAGMLVVVFVFAPRFNRALLELDAGPTKAAGESKAVSSRPALGSRLGRLICRKPGERAAFELVWLLCGRDRQFKLRTYPGVAIVFVVGGSVLFSAAGRQGIMDALHSLPHTSWHLYLLYLSCAIIPSALLQLRFSPHYQAAWVYEALPVRSPGEIMRAALKAVVARYVVPAYLVVCLVVAAIWGTHAGWDIVMGLCAVLFISALQASMLVRTLPFSEAFSAAQGSGRVGQTMVLMLIPAAIGVSHYVLGSNRLLLVSSMVVMLALAWGLSRRYGRVSWREIRLVGG